MTELLTLAQMLYNLRRARGLTQRQVAQAVGVAQGTYSHWESGTQALPAKYVAPLAAVLGVDAAVLEEVRERRGLGRPALPVPLGQRRESLTYEISGTVDDLLRLGPFAREVWRVVEASFTPAELARFAQHFPRDSEFELLGACCLVTLGAYLARLSLADLRSRVLSVMGFKSMKSAAYLNRDVLVLDTQGFTAVFVPQVWTVSVVQSEWYRLDFLVWLRGEDGTEREVYLEIDGSQHKWQQDRDERRVHGIPLRRVLFTAAQVCRSDFGARVIDRLLELLREPELPPSALAAAR